MYIVIYFFNFIAFQVSSEQVYFWLNALKALSLGEKELEETPTSMSEFLAKISQAGMYHHKAIVALKVGLSMLSGCKYK